MEEDNYQLDPKIKQHSLDLAAQVELLCVTNNAGYQEANGLLRLVITQRKSIKDSFAKLKKPFNEAMDNLRAEESKALEPLLNAESAIKKLMTDYDTLQQKKAEEERKKLEAAAKQMSDSGLEIQTVVKVEAPKATGTSYRITYDFDIVDINLIPREFLSVDEVKIRKVVTAMKEQTNIPGIKVKQVKTQVTRGYR
jgi:vacuolar-type H+-ATPase catalytic subunit A/Vma1